jgi:hypothetical protein
MQKETNTWSSVCEPFKHVQIVRSYGQQELKPNAKSTVKYVVSVTLLDLLYRLHVTRSSSDAESVYTE